MISNKLKISIIVLLGCFALGANAQILQPVKWSYASKKINASTAIIYFKADIADGWHIYAVSQKDGGPVRTKFQFSKADVYSLIGNLGEPLPLKSFDKTFGMEVMSFKHSVVFKQKINLKKQNVKISGVLTYMACNDHQCLSPEEVAFDISVD